MRYVDIYNEKLQLLVQDCKQIGSADTDTNVLSKQYTMADGSICMYTAGINTSAEIELECTAEQAKVISSYATLGKFYFAGIRLGTVTTATPTDSDYCNFKAIPAYITGNIQKKIISVHADLFSVKIPVKFDQTNSEKFPEIPVLFTDFDQIFDREVLGMSSETEFHEFSIYSYRNGVFIRKQPVFTELAEISVTIPVISEMELNSISGAIFADHSEIPYTDWGNALTTGTICEAVLQLHPGANYFDSIFRKPDCKTFHLQFCIYRKENP